MMHNKIVRHGKAIFLLLCWLSALPGSGQQADSLARPTADTAVAEVDLPSILFKKAAARKAAKPVQDPGKLSMAILPVVGYTPANGFVIGGAVSLAKNFGDPANTRPSSALINATTTTKDQVILIGRAGIALPGNEWLIEGDVRLLFFTQDTHGLGVRLGDSTEPDFAPGEPMLFDYLRIYGDVYKRILGQLYVGFGLHFDGYNKIVDQLREVDSTSPPVTAHYKYSTLNGFPLDRYSASGFQLGLRWDSRDNIANPYKGWFASFALRYNPTWMGSDRESSGLEVEGRYYLNVSKKRPQHLVAFWLRTLLTKEGEWPYLSLPSIGWDTYNRTGRGYIQGRFRGPSMFYFETEYRYPITANGLLGGTIFTNITSASGEGQGLFNRFAPAMGAGLRIKFDKLARTNITVDYGVGANRQGGWFFSLQEAF